MTTEALEILGANINFIEIWLKLFDHNYEVRCVMYNKSMKDMFKQIPLTIIKALSSNKKSP